MVKGVSLLTPRSVNEMMNTKVQHDWETPSQPCGRWRWKNDAEDEKMMVKVGNKNEAVVIFHWQINTAGDLWKFPFDGINHFLPPTTSCLPPLLAPILIIFIISHLHWDCQLDWLGVSHSVELWCSMYCSLTLASVTTLLWPWLFVLDLWPLNWD